MKPAIEIANSILNQFPRPNRYEAPKSEDLWAAEKMRDLIAAAITEARAEGARDMRERAAKKISTGDYCRYVEHVQGLCGCDVMADALRALPDSPEGDAWPHAHGM